MQTGCKKTSARSKKTQDTVTDQSQIDRFKEAARQLEADEGEAAFDEKLKQILPQKTPASESKHPNKPRNKR
ncbi:MAG: hypothetical protein KGI54_17185 [Pseudomonadota bacterium]|nr:hypothetical protein [Pseudomonadota bacterium]